MAILKPATQFSEKWMRVDNLDGLTLFMWSGFVRFATAGGDGAKMGVHNRPLEGESLVGEGSNDSVAQLKYVDHEVQMLVGPHWQSVRQVCPRAWIAGHEQLSPDEADGMGYCLKLTQMNFVMPGNIGSIGTGRIELRLSCRVAGGFDTSSPAWGHVVSIGYQVSALGLLAAGIGSEGVFFGDPGF